MLMEVDYMYRTLDVDSSIWMLWLLNNEADFDMLSNLIKEINGVEEENKMLY